MVRPLRRCHDPILGNDPQHLVICWCKSEAERLFNEALKGRQRELGDDHPETLKTKNDLAMVYTEQPQYNKVEPLLLEALKGRRLKLGDTHPHTKESLNNLIALYEAWNKPEKAKEWRAKLAQIEDSGE